MFPTQRDVETQGQTAEMEGVEHLGQYVFEMTKAKVEAIKKGKEGLPPPSAVMDVDGEDDEAGYAEEVEDMEDVDVDAVME